MEPEKRLDLSDVPGFYSHLPIINKNVKDILEKYFYDDIELLPTISDEGEFWIVNIIKVLDCINYEKSDYKTFPDEKRILRFRRYSFIKNMVINENIFKIKDESLSTPFVTDKLKK